MKKNIPNYITLLNLLCGILSIVSLYSGSVEWSVYFIVFAAIFDFMDGAVARIFKLQSELGKQLDSLADVVSFGLAPGFIMFFLLKTSQPLPEIFFNGINLVPFIGFLVPLFSAWRLANFNIDVRQEEQFIGIPTPASALMIVALALINQNTFGSSSWMAELTGNSYFLISATLILSILLVAEIPLLSLKFKNLKWNGNQKRFILIILSIALIAVFQISAIPIIFLGYIIISLILKK
ncbi:MAG: CDP-diacylglycerol--serine O-phosphatidyltransferase [Bacteroidetes bacterium HGW-Bacteroidetes-17]|jgi:CDP-diacylglycerol--serine O-phosphatidyltransferase|nr:MAG: CDP-diacylglycerol--serine O-phosphatidyltransferase [Bacteroidetes bacterium HGW-Bacteroidetes-17]